MWSEKYMKVSECAWCECDLGSNDDHYNFYGEEIFFCSDKCRESFGSYVNTFNNKTLCPVRRIV